jgi:hypothetical protein
MTELASNKVYADYRKIFNSKYGSGLSRRNVEIYVPIVNNFTFPLDLYNNGYVKPPDSARKFKTSQSSTESQLEDGIKPYGQQAFRAIDTNPNYRGNGTYNPEEKKYAPLFFVLPEFAPAQETRLVPPKRVEKIPLDLRRQAYI